MTYTVTTIRPLCGYPSMPPYNDVSRRAVGTLDEHQDLYEAVGIEYRYRIRAVELIGALPESGGTITLPDGTIIEVTKDGT